MGGVQDSADESGERLGPRRRPTLTVAAVVQRIHLWLGLLLGAQVLLWMASGVVMSWFPIELVRGETNAQARFASELEGRSYAHPGGVIVQTPGATELILRGFLDRTVYEVRGRQEVALYDALSGEKLSPLNEAMARKVAERDFVGAGKIIAMEWIAAPSGEYRRSGPVWRATFDDRLDTRLYISPYSGNVEARRNSIWRLYDFFWMLHIMDYEGREDFNNPLIRTASATGLGFALTGIVLVLLRLRQGRYQLRFLKAKSGPEKPKAAREGG